MPDASLQEILADCRELGARAVAWHRHPTAAEERRLARDTQRLPVLALFGDGAGPAAGAPLLVVDGGPAPQDPDERERALEELCRRIHGLDWNAVALRTPAAAGHFPAPAELPLLKDALPRVGYWHDAARGGDAFLDACGGRIAGASFDPLVYSDLAGLREAMGERTPAVIDLEPGAEPELVLEALARAGAVFRG
ncbi:MAG: hypothetical protein ACYTGZ_08930 [Planctomycetota bacterium]|jgi:hypothetical protein